MDSFFAPVAQCTTSVGLLVLVNAARTRHFRSDAAGPVGRGAWNGTKRHPSRQLYLRRADDARRDPAAAGAPWSSGGPAEERQRCSRSIAVVRPASRETVQRRSARSEAAMSTDKARQRSLIPSRLRDDRLRSVARIRAALAGLHHDSQVLRDQKQRRHRGRRLRETCKIRGHWTPAGRDRWSSGGPAEERQALAAFSSWVQQASRRKTALDLPVADRRSCVSPGPMRRGLRVARWRAI